MRLTMRSEIMLSDARECAAGGDDERVYAVRQHKSGAAAFKFTRTMQFAGIYIFPFCKQGGTRGSCSHRTLYICIIAYIQKPIMPKFAYKTSVLPRLALGTFLAKALVTRGYRYGKQQRANPI